MIVRSCIILVTVFYAYTHLLLVVRSRHDCGGGLTVKVAEAAVIEMTFRDRRGTKTMSTSTSHCILLIRGGGSASWGSKGNSNQDDDRYSGSDGHVDADDDGVFSNTFHTYYNIPFNPETQHFKAVIRPQASPPMNPNPPPTFEYLQDLLDDRQSSSLSGKRRGFGRSRRQQHTINSNNKMMVDLLIDQITGTEPGVVTDQYIPSRMWMWDQFFTKILVGHALHNVVRSTLYATAVCLWMRWLLSSSSVTTSLSSSWMPPLKYNNKNINIDNIRIPIIDRQLIECILSVGYTIWKSFQGLTTGLLVVFVAQAYYYWLSMYNTARSIQARISDIMMTLSTHSSRQYKIYLHQDQQQHHNLGRVGVGKRMRTSHSNNDKNINGSYFYTYTTDSEIFLEDMQHKMRLMHILWWASTARRYRILLTDTGINRMVAKGIIKPDERLLLEKQQLLIPRTQYYVIFLEWMVWKIHQASESKTNNRGGIRRRKQQSPLIEPSNGVVEQVVLDRFCSLRSLYSLLRDKLSARMSMTYAVYVEILVDAFLLCAPAVQFMQLGMVGAIISTVLLNVFYGGLVDLAFALMDPFDNEGDYHHRRTGQISPLYLDLSVLIRDTNVSSRRSIVAASNFDW